MVLWTVFCFSRFKQTVLWTVFCFSCSQQMVLWTVFCFSCSPQFVLWTLSLWLTLFPATVERASCKVHKLLWTRVPHHLNIYCSGSYGLSYFLQVKVFIGTQFPTPSTTDVSVDIKPNIFSFLTKWKMWSRLTIFQRHTMGQIIIKYIFLLLFMESDGERQ